MRARVTEFFKILRVFSVFRVLQQEILGVEAFSTRWSEYLTAFSDLIAAYYNMYHRQLFICINNCWF